MKKLMLIIGLAFTLISCGGKTQNDDSQIITSDEIKYAQGLRIERYKGYTLVEMSDPTNPESQIYKYAMVPKEGSDEPIPDGYVVIKTPINKAIIMTTLQLSNFIKLGAVDRVVGMPSTRFLFNEQMKSQLASGTSKRIGIEGNFDTELIMALQPELILVSPFKRGGYDRLQNLDIPLVTFLGYKETSPLGQAEWLKFTGLLLGKEEEADMIFRGIEERYNQLKDLIPEEVDKPKVLSGELHGGNWYVVGGDSYLAHQFDDAGGEYFMQDNEESGGFYVDFESVYAKAADADYWRILNSYDGDYSYDVLGKTDSRYRDFKAYKEHKVIYCNLNERPFYELSPVEPDVVLADLIKAFHPALLPDYEPVFYSVLKQ